MGVSTRTSAADLLANISKAIRLEAEDCDEDEVYLILECLRARVLDTVEHLDGTDAT